jgi:hypothetical protein
VDSIAVRVVLSTKKKPIPLKVGVSFTLRRARSSLITSLIKKIISYYNLSTSRLFLSINF